MAKLIAWKLPLHGAPVAGEVVVESAGGETNRYKSGTPVTLQRISGHRDGDATECPGNMLYAQLPELRRRTAAIAPAVTPAGAVSLAMATPATAVVYGDELTVTGTLRHADGTGVAGQRVLVQKQGRRLGDARAHRDRRRGHVDGERRLARRGQGPGARDGDR